MNARKLVIDSNVVFSALYDPASVPGRIIALALEDEVELFAPMGVRDEIERALTRKLGYAEDACRADIASLPIEWIEEETFAHAMPRALTAIRDKSDAPVVALALAMRADVVSGDKDFHPLLKPIVKAWRPSDVKRRKAP